jgi:hypothetical protein
MQTIQSKQRNVRTKLPLAKKLLFGIAGAGTVAIVGSAGIAAAQSSPQMAPTGSGYGGNNVNINTNINVNVKGDHNFIQVAISYIFG